MDFVHSVTPETSLDTPEESAHPAPFSDAERYAWMRAHRGNFLIFEALTRANYDSDFDTMIDAAIRAHGAGQHLPTLPLPNAQRRRKSDWEE